MPGLPNYDAWLTNAPEPDEDEDGHPDVTDPADLDPEVDQSIADFWAERDSY